MGLETLHQSSSTPPRDPPTNPVLKPTLLPPPPLDEVCESDSETESREESTVSLSELPTSSKKVTKEDFTIMQQIGMGGFAKVWFAYPIIVRNSCAPPSSVGKNVISGSNVHWRNRTVWP